MNLRPSHPAGDSLAALAERVRATPRADSAGLTSAHVRVTGVTLRGQEARPGDLFAALPGATSHGGRYAADAVRQGAVAVLTDEAGAQIVDEHVDVPVLLHPTPRAVLGELAAVVYGRPSEELRVIGAPGTSAKPPTTHLVEAGLPAAGRVPVLIGTVGIPIDGRDEASALTSPE